MEYLYLLSHIRILSSLISSGLDCRKLQVPSWILVQLFILKLMERTIQTLEDMLRTCVFEFEGSWNIYLLLMEVAYYNNYRASIKGHLMRFYMAGNVKLQYVEMRLVSRDYLVPNWLRISTRRCS